MISKEEIENVFNYEKIDIVFKINCLMDDIDIASETMDVLKDENEIDMDSDDYDDITQRFNDLNKILEDLLNKVNSIKYN